jgi:hypothetical protein
LSDEVEAAMKTIVLGLAAVICGGVALMPLLVQPDAGSAPLAAVLDWLMTAMLAR